MLRWRFHVGRVVVVGGLATASAVSACGRTGLDVPTSEGESAGNTDTRARGGSGSGGATNRPVGRAGSTAAGTGGAGNPSSGGGEGGATCSADDCPPWLQVGGPLPPTSFDTLAADPQVVGTVYAASASGGGVYKTTDSGASWLSMSTGLGDGAVQALAVDPFNPKNVWAGTPSGLYRSSDAGAHWTEIEAGDGLPEAWAITPDPHVRDRVYVVFNSESHETMPSGAAYATQDGGRSWTRLWTATSGHGSTFSVDGSDSSHLFFAAGGGVFESHDAGSTFQGMANGPRDTIQIVYDSNTNLLCAVTADGVASSTNDGATWLERSAVRAKSLTLTKGPVFFASAYTGVYRSTDCSTWTRVDSYASNAAVVDAAGAVYVATSEPGFQGVRRSPDGVSAFANVNRGLDNADVQALALDPAVSDGFFASVNATDIYHSSDGAASFTPATGNLGIGAGFPNFLLCSDQTLFAYNDFFAGRLFRSDDRGSTWSIPGLTLPSPYALVSAVLPSSALSSNHIVYMGMRSGEIPAVGIAQSLDGGVSFSQLAQSDFNAQRMIRDEIQAGWVWALGSLAGEPDADTANETLYLSQDAGQSWAKIALPAQGRYDAFEASVTPTGEVLYIAAQPQGLLRSDDAGAHWSLVGKTPGGAVSALAVDPSDWRTLYLASGPDPRYTSIGERGLYKSRDAGATWAHADRGIVAGTVSALVIEPGNPQVLYAALRYGGLYKTTSGGE